MCQGELGREAGDRRHKGLDMAWILSLRKLETLERK